MIFSIEETVLENSMLTMLSEWLRQRGYNALNFLVQAAIAILIYWIIYKVLTKLLKILDAFLEKKGLTTSAHHFVTALIKYAILTFVVVSIVVQLHIVEATSIAALLASAGVGISLAAQGTLSNFAGGLLLLILKPFREGDFIVINELNLEGTVEKITIYYTTIRTLYNEPVEVPNSQLTNHAVTNTAGDGQKRLQIKVGISYKEDIERAICVAERVLGNEKRVIEGTGRVIVEELGDHAVVLAVRVMVPARLYHDIRWELNKQIRIAFQKENVEIPYQQLDVHVRS